jgi:hypothetical protein
MDLKTLYDTPPWELPEGTDKILLGILRDDRTDQSDRLLAAELAGDSTVANDELVDVLLSILRNGNAPENLRGQAAISLGPALEYADIDGFEEPGAAPITEQTFRKIKETLHKLYADADDEDIVEAVYEAMSIAGGFWGEGDDEYEDDEFLR